jgi:hypothetical protein
VMNRGDKNIVGDEAMEGFTQALENVQHFT